jgi:hypothetical protein
MAVFEKCRRDSKADSIGGAPGNGDRLFYATHNEIPFLEPL